MKAKLSRLKKLMVAAIAIQAALLLLCGLVFHMDVVTSALVLIAESVLLYIAFYRFEDAYLEESTGVRNILGTAAQEAYLYGGVGIVIYDENYNITWMSDLFKERGLEKIGERLTSWLPEVKDILSGDSDTTSVQLDDKIYRIRRKNDVPMLFFLDVTEVSRYREKFNDDRIVVGMADFDNYEESLQFADESEAALISAAVRTPLTEYCSAHGILIKSLSNHRYLLVLNEKIFNELANDRFSILNKVRAAAQKQEVAVTLSMAFARGTDDFDELDDMVVSLMDLAQTRGGDQVAVRVFGEDVRYFGGSTEAAEKRSRVRVRVMAHTLRELIMKSDNVIIAGHKNADFDCFGSAFALAKMVETLKKPVCIIAKTGGVEEKLAAAMEMNKEELAKEFSLVTESEAMNQLRNNSLVIMTDHHNLKQSNGARVAENAKKVVVIDHHRRSTEMGIRPVLVYIEAGASSACELVTEMIPYISTRVDISETVATFMLTGMTIDTNHWHVRTGARTYEAASALRKFGADPQLANEYLKDTYEEFSLKSNVVASAERYPKGVVVAVSDAKALTRSLMSQSADSLLEIQGVEAAFVIANSENETCISARSAGRINVQTIMEKMHGGGHMTAAAMQRSKTSLEAIKKELLAAIDEYWNEEAEDESNS